MHFHVLRVISLVNDPSACQRSGSLAELTPLLAECVHDKFSALRHGSKDHSVAWLEPIIPVFITHRWAASRESILYQASQCLDAGTRSVYIRLGETTCLGIFTLCAPCCKFIVQNRKTIGGLLAHSFPVKS